MKTWTLLLVFCALACSLSAQGTTDKPAEQPKDTPKAEEAPTTLGLSAEFNTYIHRVYPELDPAGEHDIFKLKDYSDAEKRHAYTGAMARLVVLYITRLDLGSTIAKLFDQYARGKEGTQPTFMALHAVQMLNYPPGNANWIEAEKLLREAGAKAPDYAYPWYFLGEVELAKVRATPLGDPKVANEVIENALRIRPSFFQALLLKAEMLKISRPPREAEALKIVEPLLDPAFPTADDMDNLLVLYAGLVTRDKFLKRVAILEERKDVTPAMRARARSLAAMSVRQALNFDEGIRWMEKAMTDMDPAVDPEPVIRSRRFIAECWGMKAVALRQKNPTLSGEAAAEFDKLVEETRVNFKAASDLEAKYLPTELRGSEASNYVVFLIKIEHYEDALVFLEDYLAKTDLPASRRTGLERLLLQLRTLMDPNEDVLIDQFQDLVSRDEVEPLDRALRNARQNLASKNVRFKTQKALTFFIAQLKHRDRRIVESSAELAADTALALGDKGPETAGDALASRLEAEIECNTEEQASLQIGLVDAIKRLNQGKTTARACRAVKKLIDAAKKDPSPTDTFGRTLQKVTERLMDKKWLATIKNAPDAPRPLLRSQIKAVGDWLIKLADAAEKPADEGSGG